MNNKPIFYRGLIYVRRSAEAGETSVSLPQQVAACREYARSIGAHVVGILEHNGVSGGNAERFIELNQRLEDTHANLLIVFHQDRLARDLESWLHWLRAWTKAGIYVHSVDTGHIEIDSTQGFLTNTLRATFDELYRRQISEKMRASHAYRSKVGKKSARWAPYGYQKGRGGYLILDEKEQESIKRARELATEGMSLRGISRQLYKEGYRSRVGSYLPVKTIKAILRGDHEAHGEILQRTTAGAARQRELRKGKGSEGGRDVRLHPGPESGNGQRNVVGA